ncbi:MAG: tRNA dihydrouridine synthase [Luteolibacter sp.]
MILPENRPALVLAPMQDVTDLSFMRVIARRGAPDWFVTEYFRVHPISKPEAHILRSIRENTTGRPIYAQLIGRDPESLQRTIALLENEPIAGIDLNLGCPAPVVCRKDAGGGLLRDPATLDDLLGMMRAAVKGRFTVKTRLGFTSPEEFPKLLDVFRRHAIDGLTVHGRTVAERYQTPVHPDAIRPAVEALPCPVIANGNAVDVETARNLLTQTGAAGVMVGRGAIRNPWIFAQLDAALRGQPAFRPTHRDLLEYITDLYDELAAATETFDPLKHVQRMKRTLVYISQGIGDGTFDHQIRRARSPDEFHTICRTHLDHAAPLPVLPPENSRIFCGFLAWNAPGGIPVHDH